MEKKQDILLELLEISPYLADIKRVNPFKEPEGYFTTLSDHILDKVRLEYLLRVRISDTYQTPDGYFENVASNVISIINSDSFLNNEVQTELSVIAPLLNTINKQKVFTVPAGYFDQTNFTATNHNVKKESKVFSLPIARRWLQYAAAAIVGGVLVTGAFLFTDTKSYLDFDSQEKLSISTELKKISETELEIFINNPEHAVSNAVSNPSTSEAGLVEIKKNMQQVTDEELTQYLKENAETFDLVTSEKEN